MPALMLVEQLHSMPSHFLRKDQVLGSTIETCEKRRRQLRCLSDSFGTLPTGKPVKHCRAKQVSEYSADAELRAPDCGGFYEAKARLSLCLVATG